MVIFALMAAVFVLSKWVVPQFASMYSGMKTALPLPTQIMIMISKAVNNYWWITLPILIGLFFLGKFLINTPKGRIFMDNLKFKVPVFGPVYSKIVMLRFASMLNVLYQAGISILKIIDIVKITIGNVVLAEDLEGIKKDVADGKGISGGVLNSKLFPRLVGYMISIGEKAGVEHKVNPHSLRHGRIFDLDESGVPVAQISRFARHSSQKVTEDMYIRPHVTAASLGSRIPSTM